MARNIKKLKFLDFLATTSCKLYIDEEGISEEGEPITALEVEKKGIYTERVKRIIDTDGKQIQLNGTILIKGDIIPDYKSLTSGICEIRGKKYNIYSGYRIFNPDGTVNHTKLELM